jgi:hypothetical protein
MERRVKKIKRPDAATSSKRVTISVNREVKEFSLQQLQKLCHLTPSEVYNSLKSGKGILSGDSRRAIELLDELQKKIHSFLPPVPLTDADIREIKKYNSDWTLTVKKLQRQLFLKSQPIYFHSPVNEELQKRGSKVVCKDIHLEWYLSRFGATEMKPAKIAAAIIQYGSNWKMVRPLVKDSSIVFRLTNSTDKERKRAMRSILWMYSVPSQATEAVILRQVENDLSVLAEFEAWSKAAPANYEYQKKFQAFKSRLQTPVSSQPSRSIPFPLPNQNNFQQLQNYLESIAPRFPKLGDYIKESTNLPHIRTFSQRENFSALLEELKQHTQDGSEVSAGQIMKYIRDVSRLNIEKWGQN